MLSSFDYHRTMKEGPDIARIGALIGDPARANMLTALMSGKALTATELAGEAGITMQTTSSHLAKLEDAGLINQRKQGRYRYFTLSNDEVGAVLEALMGLAASFGHTRTRTGPRDPALRKARVCYNHLAGEMGVKIYDSLLLRQFLHENEDEVVLTPSGDHFVQSLEIDTHALGKLRRPLCRSCLDWSARRTHLAGSLGTALLNRFYELEWAQRIEGTRAVAFSKSGEQKFNHLFPV